MPEPYTPPNSSVTYMVPSLDEPADGPKAFKDFADTIPALGGPINPITYVTSNYTITQDNVGGLVVGDPSTADFTVTIPSDQSVPIAQGYSLAIVNMGNRDGGQIRLVGGNGVVFLGNGRTIGRARVTVLVKLNANTWLISAGTPEAS